MVISDPLSRDAVLDVLQQLVRTPSVNPSLAPAEGTGETAIANVARDWFAARGIEAGVEEVAPGRANSIARIGSGHGPTLVFCAHIDTVSTAGMTIPPFEPRVEGNRVYGRGSYDMKGVRRVADVRGRKTRTGKSRWHNHGRTVADEEYASIGAQHFVAHHKADACVVAEPSEGRLILAHKGFVWIEVKTEGRAAHGSRWDLGVSAIAKMGRIISAIDEFDRVNLRAHKHALVGPASQHCATIHGGAGLSTYAPNCTLEIERRTLPGETPEQVVREIRDAIAKAGEEAEVRIMLDRAPLVCSRDSKIAMCVRESAKQICGKEPIEAGVAWTPGWTPQFSLAPEWKPSITVAMAMAPIKPSNGPIWIQLSVARKF